MEQRGVDFFFHEERYYYLPTYFNPPSTDLFFHVKKKNHQSLSKGIVFFFILNKFMGHSFNQIVKLCKGCIFFSLEKVHEPFIQDLVGFSLLLIGVLCFFFSHFLVFFWFFFFSCKSSQIIHSLDLEVVFFFRRWKKNIAFSFIQSIFPQNVK